MQRLALPSFAEHCGLTVATIAGVTLIRLPSMAKKYPLDIIGLSRFAAPAL